MNTLPPGLRGLLAQRQMAQQEQQGQLGQIQGLLGIQQAQMQQGLLSQQMKDRESQRARIEAFVNSLPENERPAAMISPETFIKEQFAPFNLRPGEVRYRGNQQVAAAPLNPQLVNMPVPGQPGVTQPAWIRPGEASGVNVGGQNMPEILNPAVQQAKRDVASAGAPRTSVNVALPGDNKYIEGRRTAQATAMTDLEKAAQSAYNQFNTLDRFIQASEKGLAGGAAPLLAGTANMLSTFGINVAPDALRDTRVMEQAIGDILSNKMAELGARGLTDKDMQILRDALPRVETDRKSRVEVARIIKKANVAVLNEYDQARREEARIYPDLGNRTPMQNWYRDFTENRGRFSVQDQQRAVRRTGTLNGRRVVEYTDGTMEFQ